MRSRIQAIVGGIVGFLMLVFPVVAAAQDASSTPPASGGGGASLLFDPSSSTQSLGAIFDVTVDVDSGSQTINAAEADIAFDPKLLEVEKIDKAGSAFSLWTVDPKYDNSAGTINMSGGNTSPFSGKSEIATISFKVLAVGNATLSFTGGDALAADGKGTDILGTKSSASYTLVDAPPGDSPDTSLDGPDGPPIQSSTHPDPTKWYKSNDVKISWDAPDDITEDKTLWDQRDVNVPSQDHLPPIFDEEFKDVKDGVWYYHAMQKNDSGWSTTTNFKVQIDTAPPTDFTVSLSQDGNNRQNVTLTFSATDTTSGIDHYEIVVDTRPAIKVAPSDMADGTYKLPTQDAGSHTLKVTAFDMAGNFTVGKGGESFTVDGQAATTDTAAPAQQQGWFSWSLVFAFLFACLAAFLYGTSRLKKRHDDMEREVVRKEIVDLQDKMNKVFAALAEEIDDRMSFLVGATGGALMTPEEKQVVEKLKEALELSEEILDKEIDDIRKFY